MDIQQFLLQRINEDIKSIVEGWGSTDRIATAKSTPKTLDVLEAQKQLVYTYVTVCDIVYIATTLGLPFVEIFDKRRKLLEASVKRFAAVYSEHPDYNQKWAINE